MTSRRRKVGARREKVLLTCNISVVVSSLGGSSSSPESPDEAESRRAGGSFSPRAVTHVGDGGSCPAKEVSVLLSRSIETGS